MNVRTMPWASLAIAALLGSGCTAAAPNKAHPDLIAQENAAAKVAIMPPWIYVERVTMEGIADSYGISADFENAALAVTGKVAAGFNFQVVDSGIELSELSRRPEDMYDLAEIQRRVSRLRLDVYQVRGGSLESPVEMVNERIEKGKLRIGLEVIPFAERAGADLLCFVHGNGLILSEKKRVINLASGVLSGAAAETKPEFGYRLVLVDGSDGKVMMVYTSRFSLMYFGCDECAPGQPGYLEGLERFRQDLERDMIENVSKALGQAPGAGP